MTWSRRAALVLAAFVLVLSGCAGVTTQIDIPRPAGKYDTAGRGPATVRGYLTRPDGDGPFGAVILLHGCGGLPPAGLKRMGEWVQWYRERGWASIILDSFATRGVSTVCMQNQVTQYDRAGDAYAAMGYLVGLPFVRRDRIIIQGQSHGGWTMLRALEAMMYGDEPQRFAAGIAYYPVCSGTRTPLYAPAMVVIGDLDDWTPSAPCETLAERTKGDPHPVDVTVYRGARHSFDYPFPLRMNEYGKVVGYDPAATADAEKRVDAFLRRVFPKP